ncbi:AAA family ATPase [Jeotgalibaca caeni]|uniref:ATP-binding protein n=1 Tax=Jeotgalibaca caeni TaxID=3028623 RepID=UPI00237DE628|nr:AAA family ATPase [Jeotgalibaca caeni]MDE1549507.1 hypothetical protein [Jeotgalibaca caeni]
MKRRIHILGAAGSGTSTLGAALANVLPHQHIDTDDYFWITKFTEQRPVQERKSLLLHDLNRYESWILSGAVCGWGDSFKTSFDMVIFLYLPAKVRLERLQQREIKRYGSEALLGGSHYEQSQTFLEWASRYDTAGTEIRSKVLHEQWMADLSCPVIRIEGDYTTEERMAVVLDYLRENERWQQI